MNRLKELALAIKINGNPRKETSAICHGSLSLARDMIKIFLDEGATNQDLANAYIELRINLYRLQSTLTPYKVEAEKATYRGIDSYEVIQGMGELQSLLSSRAAYDQRCLPNGEYEYPITETVIKNSDYAIFVAVVKLSLILDNIADQFEGDQFNIAIAQAIAKMNQQYKDDL